ncbi:MAG: hypothetical protein V4597_08365 [Pseudomonadota bacterium]
MALRVSHEPEAASSHAASGAAEKEDGVILYHAGAWSGSDVATFWAGGGKSGLLAYSERTGAAFKAWFQPGRPAGCRVFMDSGAFPVFMGKATVDLDEYCLFLQTHAGQVTTYAALDVIGDPVASAANVKRMQSAGLDPVPTYHKGSPWSELDRLAGEHAYVAIGGLAADVDNPGKRATMHDHQEAARIFLDQVFHRLARRWPVKIHAFGAVGLPILERYPLYSADSSSAIRGAGFGRVMVFRDGQAVLNYRNWDEPMVRRLLYDDRICGTSGASRSARIAVNLENAGRLERHVTDLWAQRGVRWDS